MITCFLWQKSFLFICMSCSFEKIFILFWVFTFYLRLIVKSFIIDIMQSFWRFTWKREIVGSRTFILISIFKMWKWAYSFFSTSILSTKCLFYNSFIIHFHTYFSKKKTANHCLNLYNSLRYRVDYKFVVTATFIIGVLIYYLFILGNIFFKKEECKSFVKFVQFAEVSSGL